MSEPERDQVARAAARIKLPFSSFVRQAALQSSAIVERKATPKPPKPNLEVVTAPEEATQEVYYLDGEGILRNWGDGAA